MDKGDVEMSMCEVVHEVWGPHPGCAEFMSEPDVFICDDPAVEKLVLFDGWLAGYVGDEEATWELLVCEYHARQQRAELAADREHTTELVSSGPVA